MKKAAPVIGNETESCFVSHALCWLSTLWDGVRHGSELRRRRLSLSPWRLRSPAPLFSLAGGLSQREAALTRQICTSVGHRERHTHPRPPGSPDRRLESDTGNRKVAFDCCWCCVSLREAPGPASQCPATEAAIRVRSLVAARATTRRNEAVKQTNHWATGGVLLTPCSCCHHPPIHADSPFQFLLSIHICIPGSGSRGAPFSCPKLAGCRALISHRHVSILRYLCAFVRLLCCCAARVEVKDRLKHAAAVATTMDETGVVRCAPPSPAESPRFHWNHESDGEWIRARM